MRDQERIRLLLIDGTKDSRASYISNGVGNVVGKWPDYIATALWCSICIICIVGLIIILSLSLIVNERFLTMNRAEEKDQIVFEESPKKLENEFCKRATNRENHIAARSVGLSLIPDSHIQDTSENIFYSLIKPLNKLQACGVESVLRLCPDKFIYLMHFNGNNYRISNKYETFLKRRYSNLNVIRANGPNYVKASPFEGLWKGDNSSVYSTSLLTVFQFGGTTLSPNIIMTNRKIIDYDTPNCMIDKNVLFCPEQCSPYVYELIMTLNKQLNNGEDNIDKVVDLSITEFCRGYRYVNKGCPGVTKIDKRVMCTIANDNCSFILGDEWLQKESQWEENAQLFCPEIINSFANDK